MQVLVCDLHISILNEILFINGLFLKRAAPGLFFPLYQHHKLCSFQRAFSGPSETALLHKPNAQILLVSAVNHRCSRWRASKASGSDLPWFLASHLLPHKLSASALSSHSGTLGNMALPGLGVWVSTVRRRLQSLSDDVPANFQKLKAEEKKRPHGSL